jgi:hypothetical protein
MTWNYIPRGPNLMSEFVSSFSLIGCVHLGQLVPCHVTRNSSRSLNSFQVILP